MLGVKDTKVYKSRELGIKESSQVLSWIFEHHVAACSLMVTWICIRGFSLYGGGGGGGVANRSQLGYLGYL